MANRFLQRDSIALGLTACLLFGNLAFGGPALAQMTAPSEPTGTPSSSSMLQIGAGTQKVPAGTFLTIAFSTPMDSKLSNKGDPFSACIAEDFTVPGANNARRIVLPAGTI